MCPKCDSFNVETLEAGGALSAMIILGAIAVFVAFQTDIVETVELSFLLTVFVITSILAVASLQQPPKDHCQACGHQWDGEAPVKAPPGEMRRIVLAVIDEHGRPVKKTFQGRWIIHPNDANPRTLGSGNGLAMTKSGKYVLYRTPERNREPTWQVYEHREQLQELFGKGTERMLHWKRWEFAPIEDLDL